VNNVIKWLKKYWYYLVAIISALLFFKQGKASFGKLFEKIRNIKKKHNDNVSAIEDSANDKIKKLEIINTRNMQHIQNEKVKKLKEAKNDIKEKVNKLDSSEEINSELNNLL